MQMKTKLDARTVLLLDQLAHQTKDIVKGTFEVWITAKAKQKAMKKYVLINPKFPLLTRFPILHKKQPLQVSIEILVLFQFHHSTISLLFSCNVFSLYKNEHNLWPIVSVVQCPRALRHRITELEGIIYPAMQMLNGLDVLCFGVVM